MAYNGTVELASGITPKNNGTFPMAAAKDIYVDDDTRLDQKLSGQDTATAANTAALTAMATAEGAQAGKALLAKTVSGGRVTEWKFGAAGNEGVEAQAMIAVEEASNTATASHAVGDYFRLGGVLYITTAAIAVGDTITAGTNCRVAVLGDDVSDLKSASTLLIHVISKDLNIGANVIAYEFLANHKYSVLATVALGSIKTCNSDGTVIIQTIKDTLTPANTKVDFVASTNASYIRLYGNATDGVAIIDQTDTLIHKFDALSDEFYDIYSDVTFEKTEAGALFVDFNIVANETYGITTKANIGSVKSCDANNVTIDNLYGNIPYGTTVFITAEHNAQKLRFYFNEGGSVIVFNKSSALSNDMHNVIPTIADYKLFEKDSGGALFADFRVKHDNTYVLYSTVALGSVKTCDGNNDVIEEIFGNIEGNTYYKFTPSYDAPKIRIYFNNSGNVLINKANSITGNLESYCSELKPQPQKKWNNMHFFSVVDDDTHGTIPVTRFYQNCMHNGLAGNYAVITKWLDDDETDESVLLTAEEKGFGLLLHCYYQGNYWSYPESESRDIPMCLEDLIKGSRRMNQYNFTNYKLWCTPGGYFDSDYNHLARSAGMKCLISGGSNKYNSYDDLDRWHIARSEFDETDTIESHSVAGIKALIDRFISDPKGGWLILTTHFKNWGNVNIWDVTLDDNGFPIGYSRFNEVVQYANTKGCTFVSVPEGFSYIEPLLPN